MSGRKGARGRITCREPPWQEGDRVRKVYLGSCKKIELARGPAEGQEDEGGGAGNSPLLVSVF